MHLPHATLRLVSWPPASGFLLVIFDFFHHVTITPDCERCHLVPETICHAIRVIVSMHPTAIWNALSFPFVTHTSNPHDWILSHSMSKSSDPSGLPSLEFHFPICHLAHLD